MRLLLPCSCKLAIKRRAIWPEYSLARRSRGQKRRLREDGFQFVDRNLAQLDMVLECEMGHGSGGLAPGHSYWFQSNTEIRDMSRARRAPPTSRTKPILLTSNSSSTNHAIAVITIALSKSQVTILAAQSRLSWDTRDTWASRVAVGAERIDSGGLSRAVAFQRSTAQAGRNE
jgi:hypothetical protein